MISYQKDPLPSAFAQPPSSSKATATSTHPALQDVDDFLPAERARIAPQQTRSTKRRTQVAKRDWAHVVDVNKGIPNFHELVPEMAHKVFRLFGFSPDGSGETFL